MAGRREEFRLAMVDAWRRHGFKSLRQAGIRTGLNYSTIGYMLKGEVPSYHMVVRWADALREPRNQWLLVAGFPLDTDGEERPASDITSNSERTEEAGGSSLRLRHPEPPAEVLEAIREASTREEKVRLAIDYMRRPELRLRFGSDGGERFDTLIHLVRAYEKLAGVQLLPPDVI